MNDQDTGAAAVATEEPRVLVSPEMEQEPAEVAPAEQPETTADTGTADPDAPEAGAGEAKEDAQAKKPPPYKGRAEKRIQELNAARREAEAKAALYERMLMQQQGMPPQMQQHAQPKAPDFDPAPYIGAAPNPAEFAAGEYDPAYIRKAALYDLKAEQARAQMAQRQHQAASQETELMQRGHARIEQEMARLPDLREAVGYLAGELPAPHANLMAEIIANSDHGADVAMWLASDEKETRRIASLPPHRAAIEIGKIEARVEARKLAPVISKAPPPPPSVSGQAAPPRKTFEQMSDGEAAAFMQRIIARR